MDKLSHIVEAGIHLRPMKPVAMAAGDDKSTVVGKNLVLSHSGFSLEAG